MYDYIDSLHRVFKKNICPWATYMDVEMAVYMYIQNLLHKCESVLMDQYELKVLEVQKNKEEEANRGAGIGKDRNKNAAGEQGPTTGDKGRRHLVHDHGDQEDEDCEEETKILNDRILRRLIRIYGPSHECVKQFETRNDEKALFGNL